MVAYRLTISMDGKTLREIISNQQNGTSKSNRKNMPHSVKTLNLFDRNRSNY